MQPPKIAIIGSADPARNVTPKNPTPRFPYEPPVNTELAGQMASLISAEIARRGCRLLVYDSDNQFIEGEAVSGFVKATKGTLGSIVVRQPQIREPKLFREEASQPELFERRVDSSDQWEVSFYRSIADDADGVVLIGGANSVLIAGQVAIGARVPIVALEKSGGAATSVWRSPRPAVDLPTLDEHARMAHGLTPEAVGRWVSALLDQRGRGSASRQRRFAATRSSRSRCSSLRWCLRLPVICFRSRNVACRSGCCSFRRCSEVVPAPPSAWCSSGATASDRS